MQIEKLLTHLTLDIIAFIMKLYYVNKNDKFISLEILASPLDILELRVST